MNGWLSLLVGMAAAAVLVVQVTIVARNRVRARRWRLIRGEVVATRVSRAGDDGWSRTYVTTYSYLGSDGRSHIGHATMPSRLPSGVGIDILHDPAEPSRSQPVRRLGAAHIGPALLGLLCFLVGVFGIVNGILVLTTGAGIE